jgi:CHASE2 domain-containing sensor protein
MINEIGPERRVTYRAIVFLAALAAAFGFGLLALHSPEAGPELKAQDALARLAPRPARPDVVLVAMDANSVSQYGTIKAWPRSVLAAGLRRIEAGKPTSVVFDLALTGRTHSGDEGLWRTMANSRNVLLGMAYDADRSQRYTPDDIRSLVFLEKFALAGNLTLDSTLQEFPYNLFEPPVSDFTGSARGVGVFDRETDPDGVLRRARLVYRSVVQYPAATKPLRGKFPQSQLNGGKPVALTNLSLMAALSTFHVDKDRVAVSSGNNVRVLGNLTPPVNIPVGIQSRMLIRYAVSGSLPTYSFRDVATGKVKPDTFAGKVVLIGATAPDDAATSLAATPVGRIPRVEVTADALSTILDRSYVQVVSDSRFRLLGVMIVLGLVTGLLLMLVSGGRAALVTVALLLAYLLVCWGFFAIGHLLLPIWPAILTILTTFLVSLLLYFGPLRPKPLVPPSAYVPPPPDMVR